MEKPIPPELFEDAGVPDLILPENPTDSDVANLVILQLGEALELYRCRLNTAGVQLGAADPLEACKPQP